MTQRAFPLIFAGPVSTTAAFYQRLGFEQQNRTPPTGEPTYVGMRRGDAELAVVDESWPAMQFGGAAGQGVRFELFVLVDEVDDVVRQLQQDGARILAAPADMPWGERVAHVIDPAGNPVAIASPAAVPTPEPASASTTSRAAAWSAGTATSP